MRLVPPSPNVELRDSPGGERQVILSFPYDGEIVEAVRKIPHRRFDWDSREWSAPADDWNGLLVAEILERFPELSTSAEAQEWLQSLGRRWLARIATTGHDGRGWWVLGTLAGEPPAQLLEGAIELDGRVLAPLTEAGARALREEPSARLDLPAERCVQSLEIGEPPPPSRLALVHGVEGPKLRLEVLWDHDAERAFRALPGSQGTAAVPLDPWLAERLDALLARHAVQVTPMAEEPLQALLAEHRDAREAVRESRAERGDPIPQLERRLGGELAPFQWAGVRYLLRARRAFLADEQGLGKTIQALATLEAQESYPAVVVCPASMKLGWSREAARWLPHRTVAVIGGRGAVPARADITIVNYELVAAQRETLARSRPLALIVDESHYCKNPHAKRTQAVRRLAASLPSGGLRLALTGTPVLNRAEELISQLRVIGRLEDFGSGARFAERFRGEQSEERLHWHLRRRCFVRRLKSEVLPQLPAKRRTVVPVALTNEREYRLAERDVIEWLRSQPLDLSVLDARIAAALRAERLAQLGVLQRLAARGKLAAALGWIEDFLASGEALVVFARHVEVQRAVLERFPAALHLLGEDSLEAREAAIAAFQSPDGPRLMVAATRTAGQGITLTRASNVAFLELEWTPALHEQAEDRCHRIGQRDAVSAWYLLAAETIDETMATLIERKREILAAVTDGRPLGGETLLEGVVRELRDGSPVRHLRAVAEERTDARRAAGGGTIS